MCDVPLWEDAMTNKREFRAGKGCLPSIYVVVFMHPRVIIAIIFATYDPWPTWNLNDHAHRFV